MPFHNDPFFVVINKEHPLSQRSTVSMRELRDFHFIKLAASSFDSGWEQVELACKRSGFTPRFHSVFVDSLYDCPFIDIDVNKCFVIAYGGFSNGLAFNARQDVALIPIENETFESRTAPREGRGAKRRRSSHSCARRSFNLR